jgi:hypothetical protein
MKTILNGLFASFLFFIFSATNLVHAGLNDNGDGTVTDADTGLMWLKESFPRTGTPETTLKTWKQAMLWGNSLSFAGYNDWRLPSALEVASGVPDLLWNSVNNEWGHLYGVEWGNPANEAAIAPMHNYPCCSYWTSTEDPANSARAAAFFVSYDGLWLNEFHAKTSVMRFTAVRGAPKPVKAPQCRDGYDNDGNGYVDYPDDVGCSSAEDDKEFTCKGIIGLFTCRALGLDYRWLCFKIDDSTICLERIYVVVGVIVISAFGFWWFRRKRKAP